MRSNNGSIAVVVVVLISVMAVGLVGAAWYYEANKDGNSNSNTIFGTSSCTKICQGNGYAKGVCERVGSSVDSLSFQEANYDKNIDVIT